jgi:hypothetical protein
MAHIIIITTPPSGSGGGSRVAHEHTASGTLNWHPPHGLTPAQERRRIERAQEKFERIRELLEKPAGDEEE